MLKMILHTKRLALIVAALLFACSISGCVESSFDLASGSRLPHGLAMPAGLTRADVTVTLDLYTLPRAKFTLRDRNGKKLSTVTGKIKGDPIYLKNPPDSKTPGYEVVVIGGVTEILECIPYQDHAGMERNGRIVALFKVVDDPALRKELLARRGVQ